MEGTYRVALIDGDGNVIDLGGVTIDSSDDLDDLMLVEWQGALGSEIEMEIVKAIRQREARKEEV